MRGIGQIVAEGTYPVTLTKVSTKKTANGSDMIQMQATIRESGTDFDGRVLFRNFVLSNDPDKDISGILFYMQQAFLAFGADEEDVTSDSFDPEKVGKSLYGNRAEAVVTHNVDPKDADKKYANVQFQEPSL